MTALKRFYDVLPIFAQNLAFAGATRLRARSRFTPRFHEVLARWERSGPGPEDALLAFQRRRLDEIVERARRCVPFYADLPAPSRTVDPCVAMSETLSSIPPLSKETYRDRCEDLRDREVPGHHFLPGHTSGTTGTPLPLFHTPESLAEEYATVWRMRRSFGVSLRDPFLSFGGQTVVPFRQATPPFWRRGISPRQTYFSIYHMTPRNLRAYVDAIHESPARYVQGYPSSLHVVARALLEAGRPLPAGRIAAIFTSSESLLAWQREAIEEAFAAPVRDRYGTSEFAVSMTACHEDRLHVDMEFCIVEVEVEDETDDAERGPLLVTGLSTYGTPFLRYRIGDVGTRSRTPCPCGRPGPVFLDIDGRVEDFVVTPDGRLIGRLDHVFKGQLDVAEAQILQETKDGIQVLVVPRDSWSDASERALRKEAEARLGSELAVELRLVDRIPREPNGKFRAVRSRVGRLAP